MVLLGIPTSTSSSTRSLTTVPVLLLLVLLVLLLRSSNFKLNRKSQLPVGRPRIDRLKRSDNSQEIEKQRCAARKGWERPRFICALCPCFFTLPVCTDLFVAMILACCSGRESRCVRFPRAGTALCCNQMTFLVEHLSYRTSKNCDGRFYSQGPRSTQGPSPHLRHCASRSRIMTRTACEELLTRESRYSLLIKTICLHSACNSFQLHGLFLKQLYVHCS